MTLLLMVMLVSLRGAVPSKLDKERIPPDLFIELKAIPLEENAIVNWKRAMLTRPAMDDRLRQALKFAWTPGMRRPSPDMIDEMRAWLRRNREGLNLFEESLAKPKAQWPERDAWKEQPELTAMPLFIRARLFEADELAEQGDYTNAMKSLRGSLRLAQRGVEADGAFIHYLVGTSMRTLAQGAAVRFAARPQAPLALMEQLLAELPSLDNETNHYARALRVEFTYYAYPDTDLRKLTQSWSTIAETNAALALYPEECRRPFKILLDPLLVSQHPQPLDEQKEIQRTARFYRTFLTNSTLAWTNRDTGVEGEMEDSQKQLLKDIQPLMELTKDEPLPLSMQAAQRARSAYLQIDDPIGRILRCGSGILGGNDIRVFRSRTEREAARALAGLLIFQRKHGQLPGSLKALVDEKILQTLPFDFFSNGPLVYSRERRLVWSVGEDATDDGGNGNPKLRWAGEDAVWEIPELDR